MLGTNGGGFFNANSAHPYENPTPLTNFVQMLSIFLIPAALVLRVRPHGRRHAPGLGGAGGDDADLRRRGRSSSRRTEQRAIRCSPRSASTRRRAPCSPAATWKARRRASASPPRRLFAAITTAASCGAVNAMHDSFMPLGGAVPMVLMQLGEVVFGGVGSGLYGMLIFADPRRLHRRPDDRPHARVPGQEDRDLRDEDGRRSRSWSRRSSCSAGTAIAVARRCRQGGHRQPGRARLLGDPLRLQLGGNNNGSAFAGLSANTPFYNTDARRRDVVRPLRRDRAGARHRRLARGEEAPGGHCRHLADARAAVRRSCWSAPCCWSACSTTCRRWPSGRSSST